MLLLPISLPAPFEVVAAMAAEKMCKAGRLVNFFGWGRGFL